MVMSASSRVSRRCFRIAGRENHVAPLVPFILRDGAEPVIGAHSRDPVVRNDG
jgi:hypothetical protein